MIKYVAGQTFTTLRRLLYNLLPYFNTAPKSAPAIKISGTGYLIIEDRRLTIVTETGEIIKNLQEHTLLSLVQDLNEIEGITAQLISDTSTQKAISLLDCQTSLSADAVVLQKSTSLLWSILKPIAWELEDVRKRIEESIVKEMSIPTATGKILDYWCHKYKITRFTDETDLQLSRRTINETIRPRCNNVAIEDLIRKTTGCSVRVIDAAPHILRASLTGYNRSFTPYHSITDPPETRRTLGRTYCPGSFIVYLNGTVGHEEKVVELVNKHKMSGMKSVVVIRQQNAAIPGVFQYY